MSGVRGPNSALTEFLRSQGINANEIRDRYERRFQRRSEGGGDGDANEEDEGAAEDEARAVSAAQNLAEGRQTASEDPEVLAIAEAAAQKRRADDDEVANEGTALCASCHSRFTLTVYTREAPNGGFLCRNCSASLKRPSANKAKSAKRQRKKLAADLLDLRASTAPSLQDICISRVAEFIDDVDELGGISVASFSRIARILSKNRRLNPRTLQLFLRNDVTVLELWDCSELTPEAYSLIPTLCPNLQRLTLGMCGQLSGDNLVDFGNRLPHLAELYLDGAFMVRKDAWLEFFEFAGPRITSLTIGNVYRVDAEVLAVMAGMSRNSLRSLKLCRLSQMDDYAPLFLFGELSCLEHLELVDLEAGAWSDAALRSALNSIGSQLKTLVLRGAFENLSDTIVDAIAASCGSLTHLELQNLTAISEGAVVNMFDKWITMESNVGLTTLSLERCINLGDSAITAALRHSGATLVDLNINSLRRLSPASLEALATLPHLTRLDMGFLGQADPVQIYKLATSRTLKQILAYGNIRLSGMPLPTGLTVVGTM